MRILSKSSLLLIFIQLRLLFFVFGQPDGDILETSNIGIHFEGTCTDPAYSCDSFSCQACFRFYLLTKEDPNFVFFRFTFMGFVELDQNGTEISSREITSLPSNLVMTDTTSQCDTCTSARMFSGSTFLSNSTTPIQFQLNFNLYSVATEVSDPSNNRVNVHPDNMKFTIKIQSWPFLPDSIGLRMKMRGQAVGVLGVKNWCVYGDGSTQCQVGGQQLSIFSLNGTTMSGYFMFVNNASLSDDGNTWSSVSVNISGPWRIGSTPGYFIYVDVPRFANSVVYDPIVGISTHSHLTPSTFLMVFLWFIFVLMKYQLTLS